jgi:hypothetical protein
MSFPVSLSIVMAIVITIGARSAFGRRPLRQRSIRVAAAGAVVLFLDFFAVGSLGHAYSGTATILSPVLIVLGSIGLILFLTGGILFLSKPRQTPNRPETTRGM